MPVAIPITTTKNYYEILGVPSDATPDEIRKAYRKRVLETHPDKLDPSMSKEEKERAEEGFHKVHEAFEVLGDVVKRKTYDLRRNVFTVSQSESQTASSAHQTRISEEAKRRINERKEWARLQREQSEKRLLQLRADRARVEAEKGKALERVKQEEERKMLEKMMLEEMLKEMYKSTPEFMKRREAMLKRKEERERGTNGSFGRRPPQATHS